MKALVQTTRFQKGRSGNPRGRPKGIPDRRSVLREQLHAAVPEILECLILKAKEGDTRAAELILNRALPVLRPVSEPVSVPGLEKAGTAKDKVLMIFGAVSRGELSPDAAGEILRPIVLAGTRGGTFLFNEPTACEKQMLSVLDDLGI